jgi:hypothetical protein
MLSRELKVWMKQGKEGSVSYECPTLLNGKSCYSETKKVLKIRVGRGGVVS